MSEDTKPYIEALYKKGSLIIREPMGILGLVCVLITIGFIFRNL